MPDAVSNSDLRPADVLLYRGTAPISKAIQFLDGTEVSHAGLYLGNQTVGEALATGGLVTNSLPVSIDGCEWVLVRRLAPEVADMQPVLDRAAMYLAQANRYAYEQIFLLAIICLTRKVKVTPALRPLVRAAVDRAAAHLQALLASGEREPMICSEFVYRCYDEAVAEPDDRYSLKIDAGPAFAFRAADGGAAGVHADSLLAKVASDASSRDEVNDPKVAFAAAERHVASHAEIESLANRYLSEVAQGTAEVESLAPSEFAAPIANLAASARDLKCVAARSKRVKGLDLSSKSLFDQFFTTVADFVTPGDLLKTPSLRTLGVL